MHHSSRMAPSPGRLLPSTAEAQCANSAFLVSFPSPVDIPAHIVNLFTLTEEMG